MTPNVHEVEGAKIPTDIPMWLEPLVPLSPPQDDPFKPLGVDRTNPLGSVSEKPTPVSVVPLLGFVTVKVRLVLPFTGIVAAPKALVRVGGLGWAQHGITPRTDKGTRKPTRHGPERNAL